MKKAFYMMAAAAIALSSCSSEETTDVAKSSSITFRTSVGLNSRALELTGKDGVTNMTKMTVSAFDGDNAYFANKVFEKGDNNFFEAKNFNPTWPKCLIREKVVTFRMVKLNLLLSIFLITK